MQTNIDFSKMSQADLIAMLTKAQEANARMIAEKTSRISFKVSLKGAVSVYGLGRFPLTLYPSQWDALFGVEVSLKEFVETNRKACDKAAEVHALIETEGKAKGFKDAKLDEYVKQTIEEMKA